MPIGDIILQRPAKGDLPRVQGILGYLLAVGLVGLALAGRLAAGEPWGDRLPYTTFFVAALACVILTGIGPALFSSFAGLFLANWFLLRGGGGLSPERLLMGCMYLANLGIVLVFATWARGALARERTYSDALERRSTELEASERRFQKLAEAAFEGILLTREGRIIDCNDQAGALVGYQREELLGKLATDFIVPEQRPKVQKNIQEELPGSYELELLCKDGGRRIVEAHGQPTRSPDGSPLRVSVIRDVSERKRWEETMRRRTEELERLMDALPAAVWIAHDRNCKMITGNRSANEWMGVAAGTNVSQTNSETELGVHHFKTDGTEYRTPELPLQQAAASGQAVRSAEVEFRFSGGRRAWMLGSAEPLFDAGGVCRGAVAAFLDETERKAAEEALRAARDDLALANEGLERRVSERTRSLEDKTTS